MRDFVEEVKAEEGHLAEAEAKVREAKVGLLEVLVDQAKHDGLVEGATVCIFCAVFRLESKYALGNAANGLTIEATRLRPNGSVDPRFTKSWPEYAKHMKLVD